MGATEIAKAVGCKRGNVYKALKAVGLNWASRASASSSVGQFAARVLSTPGSSNPRRWASWLMNEIAPYPLLTVTVAACLSDDGEEQLELSFFRRTSTTPTPPSTGIDARVAPTDVAMMEK